MKKVLVVGSSNMDYTIYVDSFPIEGETILGNSIFVQLGGKGLNQSIALAKSKKVITNFITALGKDDNATQVKKSLKEYNVETYIKEVNNFSTGQAFIVVDKNSENKIIIVKGANGEISTNDIPLQLIKDCDCVLLQNEIPQEVNDYVITKAHEYGKIVFYNPAPYRKLNPSILSLVDYLIVNVPELCSYTSCENVNEGIKKLLNNNVKNVLVTLGSKGSILVNKNQEVSVDALKVNAVDTVAAGDTYVGYFIASIINGHSIEESMKYASKASSITVQRKGSAVSIPFGDEVY